MCNYGQLVLVIVVVALLVWFYGTLTIVGYLKSNPVYTYILNIHD